MVFQDISKSFDLNDPNKKNKAAHLEDRFFSFLIDYLVISPFVLFFLYLFYSNGFNYWRSNPAAPENSIFILILAFSYTVCFSLIQSLFIMFWKATPGQYYLKINIVFHEQDMLIFFRAFFRQLTFWLSFLLLGVPFIAMMTNKSRHTFYDRISNVSIISKKSEPVFFAFEKEYRYWQSFMATLVVFLMFLISAFTWQSYSKIVHRNASFAELQGQNFFCEELKNVNLDERLQVAIGLNLTNQLSDECLDKEADFVLWKQKISDYSLAYYAKSLTTEDVDKEKKYLRQACNGQNTVNFSRVSLGCKIAYSFLNNKFEELYSKLHEENFLNDVLKYELSLVYSKDGEIENNFKKISKYNSIKLVKKYQITEMIARKSSEKSARRPASIENENKDLIKLIGEL